MAISSISPSEEKKEKNQKTSTEIANHIPDIGKTITLRDAAEALASVVPGTKGEKIADGRLLNALKTGDIYSGFHCAMDHPVLWVSMPKQYWVGISSDEIRRIRISHGKKDRTGSYKVKLKEFSKEYMSARVERAKSSQEFSSTWAVDAFADASQRLECIFEVVIPLALWTGYLETQQEMRPLIPIEIAPDKRSGSGREAKSGWKKLNAHLAAYLVANETEPNDAVIKQIAATVYDIVEKSEKTALPELSSFEKEVGIVFELVRRFRRERG